MPMKTNCKSISVYEYQRLTVGNPLDKKDFDALRSFILNQEGEGVNESVPFDELKTEEAGACMKLTANHGQEVLTVQNYVGTILLSTGTTIEVLPKIFKSETNNKCEARKLVIEMLKTCGLISSKSFQNARIHEEKMSIFEVYIRVFLDEVFELYKKGLKSGYEQKQENEKFFKGKLLFSQHIKHNFAHAERFFVEYEEFTVNRPENRLIKTTLAFLRGISRVEENRRDLHRLSMIFEDVEKSTHIQSDFQKCTGGRNMREYETILSLCKIFLSGYSFSTYVGKHNTVALLFPMEKLFECYIAKKLQERLEGWEISTQYRGKYLFEEPKMFLLKPDIFLTSQDKSRKIILDTKWKVLSNNASEHYGISQADMYQMYAYYHRYKVDKVMLVYPQVNLSSPLSWKVGGQEIISAHFVPYEKMSEKGFNVGKLIDAIIKTPEKNTTATQQHN